MSPEDRKLPRKRERHGRKKTTEYTIWISMRQRCLNPRNKAYPLYGGRGIAICARWNNFSNFLQDMGPRPAPGQSLDRIDNDGNYEPGNCRWATSVEQGANTRKARLVTLDGKTQTIRAWEREKGLLSGTVRSREKRGWSLADAISTPAVPGQRRVTKVKRDYSLRTRDEHGRYLPECAAAAIGEAIP